MSRELTDLEKWDMGVAAVRQTYDSLSPSARGRLSLCAEAIKSCKKTLHEIAEGAGASRICAACRGECCACGKNHVTAVDLLVHFSDERKLFTPCFEQEICACLGENGCLMVPAYRPYNCVIFICERVEDALRTADKERFYAVERELRTLYGKVEDMLGKGIRYSPLRIGEMMKAQGTRLFETQTS